MNRLNIGIASLCAILTSAIACFVMAELPSSGMIVYSKGDAGGRTIHRRMIVNGQMQAEEKVVNKGSAGGDIQCMISHDGKWLAFSRSLGAKCDISGCDDYHDFTKWDVYIARLDGSLPSTAIRVDHGYYPIWGDDSHNETKTLYFSKTRYEGTVDVERSIYKCTVSPTGQVSNIARHYQFAKVDAYFFMGSPDGKKVAFRGWDQCENMQILHISGAMSGQKFNACCGCHPAWCAGSRWFLHASAGVTRDDGQYKNCQLNGAGAYHYGTSQDLKWFITRTDGGWGNQNDGLNCHIMPLNVTETSFAPDPTKKELVTSDGSWVDVHNGATVVSNDVRIDAFSVSPAAITTGSSAVISWSVTNGTSVTLNDQAVQSSGTQNVSPNATTTYTLVAQGTGGPKTQSVTLTVTQPVLTSIDITPASTTIKPSASASFTAAAKDQNGNPFTATINWTISGGGSLSASSGATTTFTSTGSSAICG